MMTEPQWIVNNLGELGVLIDGRCYFMYKGESMEYEAGSKNPDGSPMQYRLIGKREFGESVYPLQWVINNRTQPKYVREVVDRPGLDARDPALYTWRDMP